LETAAKPTEFSSLIDGFLDGKLGYQLRDVKFHVLGGGEAAYQIENISQEWVRAPKNASLLLEDTFCQAGVNLRWGGALERFVWKGAPASFGNLLNRHDEGRLVQQSYYGITGAPYSPGKFMGTPWGYNPVQGGDQHGKRSKLVEYRVSDGQIYIKCQPMDWSKDGELTPSYMENVYTLDSGMLKSVITKGQFFLSNFASAQARYCDPYLHATKNSTNSSFSLDKRLVILYNTERYVEVSNTCLVKHRHA
jgi:hypothetical protein